MMVACKAEYFLSVHVKFFMGQNGRTDGGRFLERGQLLSRGLIELFGDAVTYRN